MSKTKILVLHTSVGHGIKVTAENICEQLNKSGSFEVKIVDFQAMEAGLFFSWGQKVYTFVLERISKLWGFVYNSEWLISMLLPFRKLFFSYKSKKVLWILREFQPAIVISTETMPSAVVSYLKSKNLYRGKLVISFSDYHLHRFWLYDEADLYLCNISAQAQELRSLQVPESKIAVIGAVVSEKFLKPINKEDALRQLNLLTSMPVVLLTSGALVRMETRELFLRLLRSAKSFQIVVVCGNNNYLRQELEKISPPPHHPVKIVGYIDNMEVLMTVADVLLGKTGGPTMVEAVVKKVPIIINGARPGHEMKNLEFLLKHEVAQFARNSREAAFLAEQTITAQKRDFEQAYQTIIRPKDSHNLIEVISLLIPNQTGIRVQNYQETTA